LSIASFVLSAVGIGVRGFDGGVMVVNEQLPDTLDSFVYQLGVPLEGTLHESLDGKAKK